MYFEDAPIEWFRKPVPAILAIETGYPPLVRYAGTLWRFRCAGVDPHHLPHPLTDGQLIKIVGRQGNTLFIELETSDDQ